MPPYFILEVAPLTTLPFRRALFSYLSDEELPSGTLVRIPFAGRSLRGVVTGCTPSQTLPPAPLKSITSRETNLTLTKEQVALAERISNTTFTPLGKVLQLFVPKVVQERVKDKPPLTLLSEKKQDLSPSKKLLTSLKKNPFVFLHIQPGSTGLMDLLQIAKSLSTKNSQILVIVPEILFIRFLESLANTFFNPENIAILHSHLAAGTYFKNWERIQNNTARIIFATRHGLFAPFHNLTTIIQVEPTSESYKQWDMSPRYETRHILPFLQEIYKSNIIQAGPLPPLSTLKATQEGQASLEFLPIHSNNLPTPQFCNLRLERYQKKFTALSGELREAVRETLAEGKQIILFTHQGGIESFSVCEECKTIFRCPKCESPLKLGREDIYTCKRCHFTSSLFPSCQNCQSIRFRSVGFGTQKIFREIQKEFPGANVIIADKSVFFSTKTEDAFLKTLVETPPNIVICTETFFRLSPLSRLSLVAIIDADAFLSFTGIDRDEHFVSLVNRAQKSLAVADTPKLFLQTFHPENALFRALKEKEAMSILEDFLEERRLLSYPPFTRTIAIGLRRQKKTSAHDLQKFTAALEKERADLWLHTLENSSKKYSNRSLVIRYIPPLQESLHELLSLYADTLTIDPDPLSLL